MQKEGVLKTKKGLIKKRDRSNFELSLDYPLTNNEDITHNQFKLELFFFPPSTLSSSAGWHKKDRFYQNLKNNLRWHTPEEQSELFKFKFTLLYLQKKEKIHDKEKLIEKVIGENKLFSNRLIRKLKIHSDHLENDCQLYIDFLAKYRQEIISRIANDVTVHDQVKKHCCWCDEYLSYFLKNFILKKSLEKDTKWREVLENENNYITRYKDYDVAQKDLDRSRYLQRASMLKKFINEILYLDLKLIKKTSYKKNLAAATAAGLAAAVNFFAQYSSHYGGNNRDTNLKIYVLLILAVLIYVVKDRIKDLTKEYFNNKMLSTQPDFENDIISKRMPGVPELKLGSVKEVLKYKKRQDVPDDVYYVWKKARHRATGSLAGHGDVMAYEKKVTIIPHQFNFGKNWCLKDVIRYDLKDFLSSLEESTGMAHFFDEDEGKIITESEKSYSLDIVLKKTTEINEVRKIQYHTYRLFLEKDILIRIEDTSELQNYTYKEKIS